MITLKLCAACLLVSIVLPIAPPCQTCDLMIPLGEPPAHECAFGCPPAHDAAELAPAYDLRPAVTGIERGSVTPLENAADVPSSRTVLRL